MKKSLSLFISMLTGGIIGAGTAKKISNEKLQKTQAMSEKHLALFLMMNKWVQIKQEGKNISLYFEQHGYEKIAIYGMGHAGESLLNELQGTATEIVCGIDQKEKYSYVDVITLDDTLPEMDAVVVTAITYFDEIKEKLSAKVSCPILSLEDILQEL